MNPRTVLGSTASGIATIVLCFVAIFSIRSCISSIGQTASNAEQAEITSMKIRADEDRRHALALAPVERDLERALQPQLSKLNRELGQSYYRAVSASMGGDIGQRDTRVIVKVHGFLSSDEQCPTDKKLDAAIGAFLASHEPVLAKHGETQAYEVTAMDDNQTAFFCGPHEWGAK